MTLPRPFRLSIVVTVLVLTGTVTASAAPTVPAGRKLAAGAAVVGPCGTLTGAQVSYNARSSTVLEVTVSNLPSTCNGARLSATASNVAGSNLGGGGPVTVAATRATVTLSANPTTASATQVRIVLVGP